MSHALAMMHYRSFWDWLFSMASLHDALVLAAAGTGIGFSLSVRRFPFAPPFFSGVLVLALGPFIFTAFLAVLQFREFLDGSVFGWQYTEGRLRGPIDLALSGAGISCIAVGLYATLYVLSGRRRNAVTARSES
jgi:hypothetical protein